MQKKDQYLLLLKALKWLDKFSYTVMTDGSISVSKRDYLKILFYLQLVKIHTTYGATIELIKKGYGMDAMVLVRTMLNNLINCVWIMTKKQKTRAKRFINYNFVIRKKFLEIVKKYPNDLNYFQKIINEEKQINLGYKKVEKYFKKDINRWPGMTIYQMAKETKLEWDYDFVYGLASSLEHSDINSLNHYMEEFSDAQKLFKFRGGPSANYVNQSGITAIKYMGNGLELFVKSFKLKNNYKKRLLKFAAEISTNLKKP